MEIFGWAKSNYKPVTTKIAYQPQNYMNHAHALHRVLDPYSMEIFQKEVPVLVGNQLTVKVNDHCNNGMQACILLINVYLEKLTPSI